MLVAVHGPRHEIHCRLVDNDGTSQQSCKTATAIDEGTKTS
jgi:hypothetical protein